jgi:rhamnosyltransferase
MRRAGIAAVVVVYHPQHSLLNNVLTYLPEVQNLYVFDNSPESNYPVVEQVCQLQKVKYLAHGQNVGVATALNIAARSAIDEGYEFLLTMDQDSFCYPEMVSLLLSKAQEMRSAGVVSPFIVDRNARINPPEKEFERMMTAVTSGSLMNLEAFKTVGGFLDSLFIDGVDTEYCLRLQIHGFSVIRVNRALLSHAIGTLETRNLFGVIVHPTHHKPTRFYYQARNSVYLRKRYRTKFPEYFKLERRYRIGRIVKMLLYESERFQKAVMLVRGNIAGRRNDFSNIPI